MGVAFWRCANGVGIGYDEAVRDLGIKSGGTAAIGSGKARVVADGGASLAGRVGADFAGAAARGATGPTATSVARPLEALAAGAPRAVRALLLAFTLLLRAAGAAFLARASIADKDRSERCAHAKAGQEPRQPSPRDGDKHEARHAVEPLGVHAGPFSIIRIISTHTIVSHRTSVKT